VSWRDRAACAGAPLDVFFPESQHERDGAGEVAERWCAGCPVTRACREAADLYRDLGVRAGVLGRADNGAYRRDLLLPDVELAALPPRAGWAKPGRKKAA
jgi:Transcription factor WhiB